MNAEERFKSLQLKFVTRGDRIADCRIATEIVAFSDTMVARFGLRMPVLAIQSDVCAGPSNDRNALTVG